MNDLDELPDAPEGSKVIAPTAQPSKSKSKSKAHPQNSSKPKILHEVTLRKPEWTYIQLRHLSAGRRSNAQAIDAVTAHMHLTAALSSFLGMHGAAVPIDILKVEGQDVWIRVPAGDKSAVLAAVGGWTNSSGDGWRVSGWSHWDANATGRDAGQELFQ